MIEVNLTAFGPFGGVPDNPSSTLAREIAERHPTSHAWRVWRAETLEVSARACDADLEALFGDAAAVETAKTAAAAGSATAVGRAPPVFLHVHLGVHSRAKCFRVERKAYNVDDFRIPDNDGVQIRRARISNSVAADAVATTIDCERLCAAMLDASRELSTDQNSGDDDGKNSTDM